VTPPDRVIYTSHVPEAPSFFARIWLSILVAFRIVFDPPLAGRVRALLELSLERSAGDRGEDARAPAASVSVPSTTAIDVALLRSDGALGLLALFQREGRFVDFLEQDIDAFSDGDVGAAARVVHAGARRALRSHFDVTRVRHEPEGSAVIIGDDAAASVKLTGNVGGAAPYRGTLRHSGWRVTNVRLPELVKGHDATLVAPAEVEL
jgi:hypothetical protein